MNVTVELVKEVLPSNLKSSASQELVDKLNQISTDPEAGRIIRENFIGYTRVLNEGRFKVEDYMNAVSYVSFKLMGYNNKESYVRAFPDRYQALVARGATDKDISAYVAAYSKNKLVGMIMEQSMIPVWVLHQDTFMKAVETQADLMVGARSEKVRSDAANSLLTHLKKPEKKEVALEINTPQSKGLDDLNAKLTQMAELQRQMIATGAATTKDVAHHVLVDPEEVEDAEIIEEAEEEEDVAPAEAPAVAEATDDVEDESDDFLSLPDPEKFTALPSAPVAPQPEPADDDAPVGAPLGPIFGGGRR